MNVRGILPVCGLFCSLAIPSLCHAVTESLGLLVGVPANENVIVAVPSQESISVSVSLNVAASNAPAADSANLRVRFYLIDANDAPVTLSLASGGTGTYLEQIRGVSYPTGSIQTGLSWNSEEGFSAALKPVTGTRLKPGGKYRLRVTVERDEGSGYGAASTYTQTTGQTIWHFTNTDSEDASPNVNVRLDSATLSSRWLIRNQTGQAYFNVPVTGKARRFDHFNAASPGTGNVTVNYRFTLRDLSDNDTVPLVATTGVAGVDLADFVEGANRTPTEGNVSFTVPVLPVNWADISPLHAYQLEVEAGHPGETPFNADSSKATEPDNWLAFSGTLRFGSFVTTFSQLDADPTAGFLPTADPNALARGEIDVSAWHGHIAGFPSHSFQGPMMVKLMANGDAELDDNISIPLDKPTADSSMAQGMLVSRGFTSLSTSGVTGYDVSVKLPRGLSYSTAAGTRMMKTRLSVYSVSLNQQLLPTTPISTGAVYLALERLPLVFAAPSLSVNVLTGQIQFTPSACNYGTSFELSYLEASALASPALIELPAGKLLHAGNDQVFRLARTVSGDVFTVSAGADGAAFIHSARLTFAEGAYVTHFPRGLIMTASGPDVGLGQFVISNDVITASSSLRGAEAAIFGYDPNNPPETNKPSCSTALAAMALGDSLNVAGDELFFRPDGSLSGIVNFGSGIRELRWGIAKSSPLTYTHTMSLANFGRLMLPAHFLPWRDPANAGQQDPAQTGLLLDNRTAALHLAGRDETGAMEWEIPQTSSYSTGALDYAGVNLRAADASSPTGITVMGGVATSSYPLRAESKFYIRPSGVSGTIQSDTDMSLNIYGMQMDLEGVKLAYLSNVVEGSALNGGLQVGGPAPDSATQFSLTFNGLRLFSDGSLDRGTLNDNQGLKSLRYWGETFAPLSMEFKQPNPCDASGGFLALGVETHMLALGTGELLRGVLGFRGADGSIVAYGDADNDPVTGVTSRFTMPSNLKLQGPGSSSYTVTPVTGAYFNKWPGGVSVGGFTCIAGAVDVPFFENLNAHIHGKLLPNSSTPTNHLMAPLESVGPFTMNGFDLTHTGLPDGVPGADYAAQVDTYRSSASYALHAKKNWLGLLNFDYPLSWDAALRQFQMESYLDQSVIVADVGSQVRALTPSTADIRFKAKLGVELPSVNFTDMAGGLLNGIGANALLDQLTAGIQGFDGVISGITSFEEALLETPDKLVRQPLITAVAAVRGTTPGATAAQFRDALALKLGAEFSENSPAVPKVVPTSWKEPVFSKLDDLNSAAGSMRTILENTNMVVLMAEMVHNALMDNPDPPSAVQGDMKEMMDKAYGVLGYVQSSISTVKLGVNALNVGLDEPTWTAILNEALPSLPSLPFAEKTDAELADTILLHFMGHSSAGLMSESMRLHLTDLRESSRGAMDLVFAGMNESMTSGNEESYLGPPGIPDMSDLQFGKITGHASIMGDSLKELRLDADINIKAADNLKMKGFVLFKDVQSDTPYGACRASQGVAAELTLGASTTAKIGSPIPPAITVTPSLVEAAAKFSFDENGVLNGLAGRLGMSNPTGALLGIVKLQQAELGFGFGGGDAYLYGKGAGKTDYYDLEAALYLGRSCNLLDVMTRVDAQAAELLSHPDFSQVMTLGTHPTYGFYAFGYGAVSVNALLGIPPSCMLNLKAGAGMGAFYFFRENDAPGHPNSHNYFTTLGLRHDLGVSGEILCLANVSARLSLIGAVPSHAESVLNIVDSISNASGILGNGKANVKASIGVSPFKVSFSKTLDMDFSYKPLSFDLDF